MNDNILVSVICNTYNHEMFVRDTLDGIVMQRTNFDFEVIVHDDASLDGTADVVREFERNYPHLIKPIYQTENQYSKGIGITRTITVPRAKGKYLAFCEGDDRWINPYKLQKQIDYMESHSDCSLCAHRAVMCDLETKTVSLFPNQRESRDYPIEEIMIAGGNLLATASYVMRKEVYETIPAEFFSRLIGDYQMMIHAASCGRVHCLQEPMAIYNFKAPNSTAVKRYTEHGAKEYSQQYRTAFNIEVYNVTDRMDRYYGNKYHEAFSFHLRYYRYHILKHSGKLEQIQESQYDEFRLIDTKRKELKEYKQKKTWGSDETVVSDVSKVPAIVWPHTNEVEVSVFCDVLNQRDFVIDKLNSILTQKTNFGFELLICDLGSTDGTAEIVKQYAQQFPEVIKAVYIQARTTVDRDQAIREHLYPLAKGQYFAWCCGYYRWSCSDKLQIQYDYMKANKTCTACLHRILFCNYENCKCVIWPKDRWLYVKDYSVPNLIYNAGRLETKVAAGSLFLPRTVFESIPDEYAADILGIYQLLFNASEKGAIYYSSDILGEFYSTSSADDVDQADRIRFLEVILNDYEKTKKLLKGRYSKDFDQKINGIQYELSSKLGDWSRVSRPEFDQYRLVDQIRESLEQDEIDSAEKKD